MESNEGDRELLTFEEYTNPGMREINEDNCGSACNGDSYCFVVADGLGGHGGGEVASRLAVDAICEVFIEKGWYNGFFRDAFQKAQKDILEEQERCHAPSRMKTTAVVLVIHDTKAYWAHIGDSRLYFFKGTKIKERTIDHSVPQMLALSGEIKESEIRNHADRNRLLRVLGIRGDVPRFEEGKPLKLKKEMTFLLCTDGFWELIEESEMEKHLEASQNLQNWIDLQCETILKNGEGTQMDNFTCIVVNSKLKGFFG